MMWNIRAEEPDLRIPSKEMETVSAVLDDLYAALRPIFERDLSAIEPVGSFRPDGK